MSQLEGYPVTMNSLPTTIPPTIAVLSHLERQFKICVNPTCGVLPFPPLLCSQWNEDQESGWKASRTAESYYKSLIWPGDKHYHLSTALYHGPVVSSCTNNTGNGGEASGRSNFRQLYMCVAWPAQRTFFSGRWSTNCYRVLPGDLN